MADYSKVSKTNNTAAYPVHAVQTSGLLRRVEPLLTPELLVSRFLKGVPLILSNGDQYTADDFKDQINMAVNDAEIEINRPIIAEEFKDKLPFDWSLYKAFIHLKSFHGPILSLEDLSIVSSDNNVIFTVPSQWIEASNFFANQINVVPLLAAFGATSATGGPISVTNQGAGIAFLAIWGASGNVSNVPAYWQIKYRAGLSNTEGEVPLIVNELVGCIASINILSAIAQNFITNSQSMSQDGISQSSSTLGPRTYQLRIEELEKRKANLTKKIKAIFQSRIFVGNI